MGWLAEIDRIVERAFAAPEPPEEPPVGWGWRVVYYTICIGVFVWVAWKWGLI